MKYQGPRKPHGVTSQKTPFFIVTAVKTSNLTFLYLAVRDFACWIDLWQNYQPSLYDSSILRMLHHIFYCLFSCYLPLIQPGVRCLYSPRYMTRVVQWMRLVLSKGPSRVGFRCPTWRQKLIQFPKCWVFHNLQFQMLDKVRKPSDSDSNSYFTDQVISVLSCRSCLDHTVALNFGPVAFPCDESVRSSARLHQCWRNCFGCLSTLEYACMSEVFAPFSRRNWPLPCVSLVEG
jgi:hypothetical protein